MYIHTHTHTHTHTPTHTRTCIHTYSVSMCICARIRVVLLVACALVNPTHLLTKTLEMHSLSNFIPPSCPARIHLIPTPS